MKVNRVVSSSLARTLAITPDKDGNIFSNSQSLDWQWEIDLTNFYPDGLQKVVSAENLPRQQCCLCKLTTRELQECKRTVIVELTKLVLEKREIANGYRYRFEGSDKMIKLLTEFIKTERRCCSFFDFTLSVTSNDQAWLEFSSPEGTREIIKYEIDF